LNLFIILQKLLRSRTGIVRFEQYFETYFPRSVACLMAILAKKAMLFYGRAKVKVLKEKSERVKK